MVIILVIATISGTKPNQLGENKIKINLTIDYGDHANSEILSVSNRSTVFDALNQTHNVSYKEYSIGVFITSIDGISQDSEHSWLYFVNGKLPSISADNYVLNGNESVIFKYVSNTEAMKYFK